MSDLIENLRVGYQCQPDDCAMKNARSGCICAEAADQIEQLEAENARLQVELLDLQAAYSAQGNYKILYEAQQLLILKPQEQTDE